MLVLIFLRSLFDAVSFLSLAEAQVSLSTEKAAAVLVSKATDVLSNWTDQQEAVVEVEG